MTTETATPFLLGTGRRKTASARARLSTSGSGAFTVNGASVEDYFGSEALVTEASAPLQTVEMRDQFDVAARAIGGGKHGQATAIALAIARALVKHDPELRGSLKKAGHLKRDPRRRERKKAGQPGARKRFQFSKR
ncbi:MAG: 30S ribosomal protein S9 [Opitutales bacterium]|nr:30S ribosomal protein S9 [Opitutales bacterium]